MTIRKTLMGGLISGPCSLFLATGLLAQTITSMQNPASNILFGMPNFGIAQGSIFVLYGNGMGPAAISIAPTLPLSTSLAGTSIRVTLGGAVYSPFIVSTFNSQVVAVMPSNVPVGSATVEVVYNGAASAAFSTIIVQSDFGISTVDQTGTGPAVVTTASYAVVTNTNSTIPGGTYTMWGTGLGPANSDNNIATNGDLGTPIQVWVGGLQAAVSYRGRSSSPGLDQINFTIPAGLSGCNVSLGVQTNTTVSNATTIPIAPGGGTCSDPTPQILFTNVPQYGSGAGSTLEGQVLHVDASSNAIACYIYVNGWWIKPYFDFPLTQIRQNDGGWSCAIVTGGYDSFATAVAAFVIPNSYNPPLLAGSSSLPPELYQASIANVQKQRPLVASASMVAVAPSLIAFSYAQHGGAPPPYYLSVSSTPSGVEFMTSLGPGCGWLDFPPGNGVAPVANIRAALNTSAADGLSLGTYNCTVTVTAPGASAVLNRITVPATLTVAAVAPSSLISLPSASLNFTYPPPVVPTGTEPFVVGNATGRLITPSLGSGCNWLNLTGAPSSSPSFSLGVGVDTAVAATLKPGSYPCTVTFTAAGTSASAAISLTLVVIPPARASTLAVDPSSMAFNYTQHGGMPPAYFMSVTSTPIGVAFTTSLGSGCSWLDFTPGNGVTPAMSMYAALNTVVADGLSPGTYDCTITVTAPSASANLVTMTVPITLTVAAPSISVYPSSATFYYPPPVPPTGTTPFGASSSPPSLIAPSLGSGCSWLNLTSANWNSPASFSPSVNTAVAATMSPGSYPCTVTFTAAGSSASATLSLTLVVR